jgi:pSer/pThr/pTyr-binding forkhead associated (FHA) protein
MSLFNRGLSQLEKQLQSIIEGSAAKLFPSRASQEELAHRLTNAMETGIRTHPDGQRIAPNLYVITVHPSESGRLLEKIGLLDELAMTIQQDGDENGLVFISPPVIRVLPDPDTYPNQINIHAQISQEQLAETSDLDIEVLPVREITPSNAFLIVDGTQVYQLNQSIVNIGRRSNNHLTLEDDRVSRVHAQLRNIKGRFMIFDLNSSGGTYVNEQRIQQCILYPGDVISLAGLPLVFGQEDTNLAETQKLDI